MPTDHRAELKKIRTFPSLVRYLRDEMDWPIDADDFEELTFEYTPDELGIDSASAAKIQEIKRLRPLSPNQPWGIFFVKFEPKRLPVVALRRILSQVVLKKRATAKAAERAAWAADDLLFVSNYGEGDARQISFAHFSQNEAKQDLPTLNVLGWDNLDTPLHLDAVAEKLTRNLAWPKDEKDLHAWRQQWRAAFTLRHREVITTSKALAVRLAELARAIRDRIRTVLTIETENGSVTKLMKAFQEALVHDLDADGFADMYAQTIAYGLLSARVTNPKANTADGFAAQLPVTNPFLKELMETFLHIGGRKGKAGRGAGIDFDELGVSEVVELLDDANMEAVVRDFGDRNPQEDPVIHFYELFLKEYDAAQKAKRGVFYTPRPVVSYIVRSVHELLQTEFGLADGLADTATWGEMAKRHAGLMIPGGVKPTDRFVTILDPATGTGTFLVEVIEIIHRTLVEKWRRAGHGEQEILNLWNDYVPTHLLPRLHGYELLMAPYAIAHLKIGLKLHETGYRFENAQRARIYLTNALEPAHDFSGQFEFMIPALAHEAEAVNAVKRQERFTVVVGNPPYAGHSANDGKWITDRIRDYYFVDGKPLGERNPKWLQDDYVKFMRFGQFCVEQTSCGLLAFITNHGYLDNPTFRGMRQRLLEAFPLNHVVDLHGNVRKGSDVSLDQNVFDIQQGVSVGIWVRSNFQQQRFGVFHGGMRGARSPKYDQLLRETALQTARSVVHPASPFYLLVPQSINLRDEFVQGASLPLVFRHSTMGVTTGRDRLCVSFTSTEAISKLVDFTSGATESELALRYGLSNKSGWSIAVARKVVRSSGVSQKRVHDFAYRPFDVRVLYLDSAIVGRPRLEVMKSMLDRTNLALCTTRQVNGEFRHAICTRLLANDCLVSLASGERTYSFPLFIEPDKDSLLQRTAHESNLANEFISNLAASLENDLRDGDRMLSRTLTPEQMFHYAYAVFHSPGYRRRYAEFLKIDFPRLPLTTIPEVFHQLARLGGELVALHLVEAPAQQALSAQYNKAAKAWRYEVAKGHRIPVTLSFQGPDKPVVGKVGWSDDTVWMDAVKPKQGAADAKVTGTVGFRGVPEQVWNFHIGGYQVCEKWLKDRKDRTLSADDIAHYHRIVIALRETMRLMREIDEVIDAHGGWPGAFKCRDSVHAADSAQARMVAEPKTKYGE